MAERSGFFPYVSGDSNSEYDSAFLAKWVASFLSNGTYDGELAVTASANMQVKLPAGRAWINGYYYRNDGDLALSIADADGVLNRRDTVVLRWDVNARSITVQVIKGTPASTAAAPAITRTTEQYDLKLAEVSIPAGTTAITQSLITDTRLDTDVCGIVHAVVDHLDTATFYTQIQNDLENFKSGSQTDFDTWKSTSESNFNTWLSGIQGILNEDEAGNLLNLINGKADKAHAHNASTDLTGQVPVANGGTGASSAAAARVNLGAASTVTYTASVPVSWTASGSYYYQQVSVAGITADDNPVADFLPGSDNAANKLYAEAWAKVQSIDTLAGAVKLWCTSAPTTAFTLVLKVVRG